MRKLSMALAAWAALGTATVSSAGEPASFVCYFQNGQHFTVVGNAGTTMIQWNDGGFRTAQAKFEEPWLFVIQEAEGNVFKMAFNVKTRDAYGETVFKDGTKNGGPLWCAFK